MSLGERLDLRDHLHNNSGTSSVLLHASYLYAILGLSRPCLPENLLWQLQCFSLQKPQWQQGGIGYCPGKSFSLDPWLHHITNHPFHHCCKLSGIVSLPNLLALHKPAWLTCCLSADIPTYTIASGRSSFPPLEWCWPVSSTSQCLSTTLFPCRSSWWPASCQVSLEASWAASWQWWATCPPSRAKRAGASEWPCWRPWPSAAERSGPSSAEPFWPQRPATRPCSSSSWPFMSWSSPTSSFSSHLWRMTRRIASSR